MGVQSGQFLREHDKKDYPFEFDGRTAVRPGGVVPLSGSPNGIVGLDPSLLRDNGPGILRSRFTALHSRASQVSSASLKEFLSVSSKEDVEKFARLNGFLGLYPTLQIWRQAGGKGRVAGEPLDSWLWHVDRLRTLETLLSFERGALTPRNLQRRLKAIVEGSTKGCLGPTRYAPIIEANDLKNDDPIWIGLAKGDPLACREFAYSVIERVLSQTLVVTDVREPQLKVAPNCCLGFLYLQLALQSGLLNSLPEPSFVLCRWCNAPVSRGKRGPAPTYCTKCLNARRNYCELEAFERRSAARRDRERSVSQSSVGKLISGYADRFGEEEGMQRAATALKNGLPTVE